MVDVEALKKDWEATYPRAVAFAEELEQQLSRLLADEKIALAVPVQRRVKTWQSFEEKLSRKSLDVTSVAELHDLIGLRIILLFRRDVDRVCDLLNSHLRVTEQYDTAERLSEDQFGYSSTHLILSLPEAWLQVPTFARMEGLVAEVQVRTAAQHAWAAASHVLQYKVEAGVPPSVRRSIHRVSALLETVDLEFERVLEERQRYRESPVDSQIAEALNVDLLEMMLDANLPQQNRVANEDYAGLIEDLSRFGVMQSDDLQQLLARHREALLVRDREIATSVASDGGGSLGPVERDRAHAGFWFTHTGLLRDVMRMEFGPEWVQYREGKLLR